MAVEKLSIELEEQLAAAVRAAAAEEGVSESDWLVRIATAHLRQQRIRAQLEAYATPLEPQTEAEIRELVDLAKRRRAAS
jgi:hypothetical protein